MPPTTSSDSWARTTFGTAWRFRLAQDSKSCAKPEADPLVADLAKYLAVAARGPQGQVIAEHRYPALKAVIDLQSNAALVEKLKVLTIAGAPYDEIARRTGLSAELIERWEAVYFDVRDRLGTPWLVQHVIERERMHGDSALAARMRLAYTVGAEAVAEELRADLELSAKAENLYQVQVRIYQKADEAMQALSLNSERGALGIQRIYTSLLVDLEKVSLQNQRLAESFRRRREKHELQQIRANAQLEKAKNAGLELELRKKRQEAAKQRRSQAVPLDPLQSPLSPADLAELERCWSRPSDPEIMAILQAAERRPEQALEPLPEPATAVTPDEEEGTDESPHCLPFVRPSAEAVSVTVDALESRCSHG